jgi:hypothetical protein
VVQEKADKESNGTFCLCELLKNKFGNFSNWVDQNIIKNIINHLNAVINEIKK